MRTSTLPSSDEVYVFARLPDGATRLVGRYRYIRAADSRPFGEFGYVGSWLRDSEAFPLDPVNLPLSHETFRTTKRGCLFGPLADSTPDRWGRELAILRNPGKLFFSPIDWLYAPGIDRVGCLDFSATPAQPAAPSPRRLGLGSIEAIAEEFTKIEEGLPASREASRIYNAGISMGGARPKAVIEFESALWIAKFERKTDTFDQCGAEHATMTLAKMCGIEAAESLLVDVGPRKAVLIKRFDRAPGPDYRPTAHFLSALSLLDEDETSPRGSYYAISAELLRHSSAPDKDRCELFRRMVFNVLCGNRDDHLKNHALIHNKMGWRLSPAFDIVPQPDLDPAHAIGLGQSGVYPSIQNCLSRCNDFGLTLEAAKAEIDHIAGVAANWRSVFADEGVSASTIERVASAFTLADTYESKVDHFRP